MTERDTTHSLQAYLLFATDIGVCGIAWSEQGITRLQLPEADRAATERRLQAGTLRSRSDDAPHIKPAIDSLQRYFAGAPIDFSDLILDLDAVAPFHRKVYDEARAIGWGQTLSYGELAQRVDTPRAARAVGQALGRNPVPIIVPCHRVLARGKKIGGFSAFGGRTTKERLLLLEGVSLGVQHLLLPGLLPEPR